MEVKVGVEGIPRVVCGVTETTTCQEVVIALAQALGRPGRYTLREKFKDFERSMAPNESLLESLRKYGEQTRDVQLTLLHNGASPLWDGLGRWKGGRYQPGPRLRREETGARKQRASSPSGPRRQSLPPLALPQLRQEAERPEETKRQRRKSLTFLEEAWGWLESLGQSRYHYWVNDTESGGKASKRNGSHPDASEAGFKETPTPDQSLSKVRGRKGEKSSNTGDRISCCMGRTGENESQRFKKMSVARLAGTGEKDLPIESSSRGMEDKRDKLRETIMCQVLCLQDLRRRIASIDQQIGELEKQQRGRRAQQEAQQEAQRKIVEEEGEQLLFWENELKAEAGYEKDLEGQFVGMRDKAAACKATLEEYKCKMQGLKFNGAGTFVREEPRTPGKTATSEILIVPNKLRGSQTSDPASDVNTDRKLPPRQDCSHHRALVPPGQIKQRRPTGPTELREWWARWSEARIPKSETKQTLRHRSELTIYLSGTRV